MRRGRAWLLFLVLALAGPLLAACSQPLAEGVLGGEQPPAMVEAIDGSDLKVVVLSPRSAERLGIQTESVREDVVGNVQRLVMPYAALLYDEHGATWAFTNPDVLSFVREPVTVERIEGDLVILSDGPSAGTLVVTVGAAELYGAETGVGGH